MIWQVDQKLWKELEDQIGQIAFFDSKGSKLPYAKLQCKNLYQTNKLLKAFNLEFSKNAKFEGEVVDERGVRRYAELWNEEVETAEKEEKGRIMRCMIKTIFEGIEKTQGKD
eukprot:12419562-Karenia_brevis.AAC.1